MTEPSVTAICLTKDRPHMLARAVECFRHQAYENKRLLILDTGESTHGWGHSAKGGGVCCVTGRVDFGYPSIGFLRNEANNWCDSDILIHWDDDDWSHPNRIAEQATLLQASGADVVGYNEALFFDTRENGSDTFAADDITWPGTAYLYRNPSRCYAIGASLCYWRRTWESKPFPDVNIGEDTAWIAGMKVEGCTSIADHLPRLICSIHGGNTNQQAYDTLVKASRFNDAQGQFARAPQWDTYCLEIFK